MEKRRVSKRVRNLVCTPYTPSRRPLCRPGAAKEKLSNAMIHKREALLSMGSSTGAEAELVRRS